MAADVRDGVVERQNVDGSSSDHRLLDAVCCGDVEAVEQLLESGSSWPSDKEGYGPIHYAAANNYADLVALLIDKGFSANDRSKFGYTPVHMAAAKGHLEVVYVLLSASCAVNTRDKVHGNTPLHEAAFNGYSRTLCELVRHRADVNIVNNSGFSALHLTAQTGHNESSRVLLYAGCSPDHKNNYGDTPLHTAARYGHAGVARILVSARCKLNEQNKNGDTALHIAAALKQKKITRLFLESGVDVNIRNNLNEKAIDTAKRKNHDEIVQLLSSKSFNSPTKVHTVVGSTSSRTDSSTSVVAEPIIIEEQKKKKKKRWGGLFSRKSKEPKSTSIEVPQKAIPPSAAAPLPTQQLHPLDTPYSRVPQQGLVSWDTVQAPFETVYPPPWESAEAERWRSAVLPPPWDMRRSDARFPPYVLNPLDQESVLSGFYQHHVQRQTMYQRQGDGVLSGAYRGGVAVAVGGISGDYQPTMGPIGKHAVPQGGLQYYRDLAGNVRQGPVGYTAKPEDIVPDSDRLPLSNTTNGRMNLAHHEPPRIPMHQQQLRNEHYLNPLQRHLAQQANPPLHGYKMNAFYHSGGIATQNGDLRSDTRQLNQREHLSYLRSRHAVAASGGGYPAVVDPRVGRDVYDPYHRGGGSGMDEGRMGGIYRSKSDETLSTVSSRHSNRHHHRIIIPQVAPAPAGRTVHGSIRAAWRAWNEKNIDVIPAAINPTRYPITSEHGRLRSDRVGGSMRQHWHNGSVKPVGAMPVIQSGNRNGRTTSTSSESCDSSAPRSGRHSPTTLGSLPEHVEANVVIVRGGETTTTDVISNPDSGYCGKVTASCTAPAPTRVRELASGEGELDRGPGQRRGSSGSGAKSSRDGSIRSSCDEANTDDASISETSERSGSHISLCNSV